MPDEALSAVRKATMIEEFPATADPALAEIERWLSGGVPLVDREALAEFVAKAPIPLLHDCFYRRLPFGTGGVRGTVGFGPNRLNASLIALTAQAHSDFLNALFGHLGAPAVVLANDVREFNDVAGALAFMWANPLAGTTSRSLGRVAAGVYAANGLTVYMPEPAAESALLTTPELSFVIRELGAKGGANLSASHNPPDDNGIKVYDDTGGQYLPPYDQELADAAASASSIRTVEFQEALAAGSIVPIPVETTEEYHRMYLERADRHKLRSTTGTRILFTPLCGCGQRTVGRLLGSLGYDVVVPPREGPDGTFAEIPLLAPNPEVPAATKPAKRHAGEVGATIVIASDPDADRLGVEVKVGDRWVHLSGNQIACILGYRLFLDPLGPLVRGPVVQTLVTTPCLRRIGELAGVPVTDHLLVGFKWISGEVLAAERAAGPGASEDDLLCLGAEESHGYLVTPRMRDKDAASAAIYLAKLHEELVGRGATLVDYLAELYRVVGEYGDAGRSILTSGSAGFVMIRRIMDELRKAPPECIGGLKVLATEDRWDEQRFGPIEAETAREARNVLVITLEAGRVTIRPSGTEPKLKFYVQTYPEITHPDHEGGPQAVADAMGGEIYSYLLGLAGIEITGAAIELPDVISVTSKQFFDREVFPVLLGKLASPGETTGSILSWLTGLLGPLIPGTDKLTPARSAIRSAVVQAGVADAPAARALVQRLDELG
ncbi:MAG: hypothetical protein ACT4OM_10530 [Actinomycetota bacterium]